MHPGPDAQKSRLIADIHRQYVRAGANIIETNTFAANRFALARFNLRKKQGNKRVAVRLAGKRPARRVCGRLDGPLRGGSGETPDTNSREYETALTEQLQALLDEKIDLIIFETFSDIPDLLESVRIAKKLLTYPYWRPWSPADSAPPPGSGLPAPPKS